ncbi:MAG: glucokinase [Syntrophales bacterium]|nr:glucokinase [Syntrophales bacterium]
MLLAGDIGGTKTHLGVFSPYGDPRKPLHAATLPSGRYPDPETMIREFLAEARLPVTSVCLGVAGPVREGAAEITNLPWRLSAGRLREVLGTPSVRIVNDVEAMAWAIPTLGPADLEVLSPGEPAEKGTLALIAPGTGLGEAFLTWNGFQYRVHPSEGGHADFAPAGEQQAALLAGLQAQFDHVDYETVCSGRGLRRLYEFLRDGGSGREQAWLTGALAEVGDPNPVIVAAALERGDDLCRRTLDLFAAILAAEAGNLALKVMADGGVYLGGGIPRRILPVLRAPAFLAAFRRKGRMAGTVARIPVTVIVYKRAALLGAVLCGLASFP